MPILTAPIVTAGAVVEILLGVPQARREMLLKHGLPVPPRLSLRALIDTGASITATSARHPSQLGLGPIGELSIYTPSTPHHSPHRCECFAVSLSLACAEAEMHFPAFEVAACEFGHADGVEMVLGRDFLRHCLLVYAGTSDSFSLAF